jgi:hypothetical protein
MLRAYHTQAMTTAFPPLRIHLKTDIMHTRPLTTKTP